MRDQYEDKHPQVDENSGDQKPEKGEIEESPRGGSRASHGCARWLQPKKACNVLRTTKGSQVGAGAAINAAFCVIGWVWEGPSVKLGPLEPTAETHVAAVELAVDMTDIMRTLGPVGPWAVKKSVMLLRVV